MARTSSIARHSRERPLPHEEPISQALDLAKTVSVSSSSQSQGIREHPQKLETFPGNFSPAPYCRHRRFTEKWHFWVSSTFWPLERKTDFLALIYVLTVHFNVSFDNSQGDVESASALFLYSLYFSLMGTFFKNKKRVWVALLFE